MMALADSIIYMATLGLTGFLGSLFVHIIDKKSEKMIKSR